nr:MAG TPA: hypothetical protein [Caudoviricetes sp.]
MAGNLIGAGAACVEVLLPCNSGQNTTGRRKRQAGEKLRGCPGISGTGNGARAGAERFTRGIKYRTALCCVHTRPF